MMMQKPYRRIADRIKEAHKGALDWEIVEAADALQDLAHALTADFERDNPNFDRAAFLAACGLNT